MNLKDTRGYRNNNPGNLRHGSKWQGLAVLQKDREFCQFVSMTMGMRALCKLLNNYVKNGHNTITKIISRYAPNSENNTKGYIATVSKMVSIPPDRVLGGVANEGGIKSLAMVAAAIVAVENGDRVHFHYWYCMAYVVYYDYVI